MTIRAVLFDLDAPRRTAVTPHEAARRYRLRGPSVGLRIMAPRAG
jgi:hypothetical protein